MCSCRISTEILFEQHKAKSPKTAVDSPGKNPNIETYSAPQLQPGAKMQQDASCFVGPSTGEQEQSYSEGGHRNKHQTEGDLSNLWEVPVLLTLSEEWEQVQDGLLSIQCSEFSDGLETHLTGVQHQREFFIMFIYKIHKTSADD